VEAPETASATSVRKSRRSLPLRYGFVLPHRWAGKEPDKAGLDENSITQLLHPKNICHNQSHIRPRPRSFLPKARSLPRARPGRPRKADAGVAAPHAARRSRAVSRSRDAAHAAARFSSFGRGDVSGEFERAARRGTSAMPTHASCNTRCLATRSICSSRRRMNGACPSHQVRHSLAKASIAS